jgi:hypothetical protein
VIRSFGLAQFAVPAIVDKATGERLQSQLEFDQAAHFVDGQVEVLDDDFEADIAAAKLLGEVAAAADLAGFVDDVGRVIETPGRCRTGRSVHYHRFRVFVSRH